MLTPENRQLAEAFKAKLFEAGIQPLQFIVFGSRARGDFEEYSDLDVMIVLDDLTDEIRARISHISWELGFERNVIISPVTFTSAQLQSGPHRALPLLKVVKQEGIAV
ncbi:MAG: nucleotidyltransferase domain-containing protein [Candidatus Hydrogenedentes bacterium]|nr:nucleotidyltransferase domain-containing protein [Candidatus Hydrogenedentota bacterium]